MARIKQHVRCVVGHEYARLLGDYRSACPYCRITLLEKENEELRQQLKDIAFNIQNMATGDNP